MSISAISNARLGESLWVRPVAARDFDKTVNFFLGAMDRIEEQLRQLLARVFEYPEGSQEHSTALNRLLLLLQGLPEFRKYTRPGYPDYDLEALNKTWKWFWLNVKNFQPRTSSIRQDLTNWIGGYLRYRLKDAVINRNKQTYRQQTTNLEQVTNHAHQEGRPSKSYVLDVIESSIVQAKHQARQEVALRLKIYVQTDPQEKLRNCYPRHRPECNCQSVTIRRYFKEPADTLAALAREYKINYQTLNWHWKQRGIPLLRAIAIQLGYRTQP